MKYLSISFLAGLLAAGSAHASSISVSDFTGSGATFAETKILTSTGALLPNGGALVRVGFFTSLSAAVTDALKNPDKATAYAAINSYFVALGEDIDSDLGVDASGGPRIIQRTVNGSSVAGRLAGSVGSVNVGAYSPPGNIAGVPANTRLFVLVYDSLLIDSATELAIFSADDLNWLMPSDSLASTTLNTTAVDTAAEIFRGSVGSIRLAPLTEIPEAGSSVLAMGALALGLRRKRRSA